MATNIGLITLEMRDVWYVGVSDSVVVTFSAATASKGEGSRVLTVLAPTFLNKFLFKFTWCDV